MCKNGTILCTAQLNVLLRWYTGNGRTNSDVLYMEWDFPKERAKHENYLLLFCIRFVPVHDLEDYYFDGTDGCQGFPRIPLAFYNKIYPLNKILCPRCKKTSNEVFVPKDNCPCFSIQLIERAPVSLSERQPERHEIFRYQHPLRACFGDYPAPWLVWRPSWAPLLIVSKCGYSYFSPDPGDVVHFDIIFPLIPNFENGQRRLFSGKWKVVLVVF